MLQKGYVLLTIVEGCIIGITKRASFWCLTAQLKGFVVNGPGGTAEPMCMISFDGRTSLGSAK